MPMIEVPILSLKNEVLTVTAPRELKQEISRTGAKNLEIHVIDPRDKSYEQVKKVWAMCRDIAEWTGDFEERLAYTDMLHGFIEEGAETGFTLSASSVSTAKAFIEYIIHFCVVNNVPMREPLYNHCMDDDTLYKYVYWCVETRTCAVTGRKNADIHEVEAVGMGRNRNTIHHLNQLVLPLCREKHREAHTQGFQTFMKNTHLTAIRLDRHLCGVLGWKE